MTDYNNFVFAGTKLTDLDIPRIGALIGIKEDLMHATIDVETGNRWTDSQGRLPMLYEPHVAYRAATSDAVRTALVGRGLAYRDWGEQPYPADSYPRVIEAMQIDVETALRACSWGGPQILGEEYAMSGYASASDMVTDFLTSEAAQLTAMAKFIIAKKLDDDLRVLQAKLDRGEAVTADDCRPFVKGYNGGGYEKNGYHVKYAAALAKWHKIPDTPYDAGVAATSSQAKLASSAGVNRSVQQLLRDKGYPEVGNVDGTIGPRTRNAILAFQADHDLELTGKVSDSLLADLVKAEPRQMSDARATATAADLKAALSIQMASTLKKAGATLLTASGIGGLVSGSGDIDQVITGVNKLKSLTDVIVSISPWILGGAGGLAAIYFGGNFIKEQVQAYREGRHV